MRTESITVLNVNHGVLPEDTELIQKLEKTISLWLREQKVWEDIEPTPIATGPDIRITFPSMFSAYHNFFGMDFYVYVLIFDDQVRITAVRLKTLEDVPLGLTNGFADIPEEMYNRLADKTRCLENILRELKTLKSAKKKRIKDQRESIEEYNKLIALMIRQQEGYKDQKRQIKKLIRDAGIDVKPGSPLSKLLRLDNVPR